jgi:hypothetical protein
MTTAASAPAAPASARAPCSTSVRARKIPNELSAPVETSRRWRAPASGPEEPRREQRPGECEAFHDNGGLEDRARRRWVLYTLNGKMSAIAQTSQGPGGVGV